MNPIEELLMAANGRQGPMQDGTPDAGGPPGMPMPPPVASFAGGPPPAAPLPGGQGGPPASGDDQEIASTAAQHLLDATAQVSDPALKATLTTALVALHKYLAQHEKEHHQALAGKLSPRLMAQAHGRT